MDKPESLFDALADKLAANPDTERGQMFGKPCVKVNGKAFASFQGGEMVFKLPEEAHREAISLEGSHLWDPSGKGRPMKEWVCIPAEHSSGWQKYAELARDYVLGMA